MTLLEKIKLGAAVVVVTIALIVGYFVLQTSPKYFGSVGNLKAENYINYIRQNGGYNSDDPIQTSSTFSAGAATLTGALTGTSAIFSGLVQFDAGTLLSSTNSSTTAATSQTLIPSDVNGFSTVVLTPTVGNDTVTLFASSTAATFLPAAGDAQDTCFINGTTTSGIYLTFAGGTGTNIQVASSSATALGSLKLAPQKVGCFHFVRANSTATTFDIQGAYTAYQ